MAENKWEARVERAAKHANDVYSSEVDRLSKKLEGLEKKDAREVKHVEHQVEVDAWFAAHHLEYLLKVVEREIGSLADLLDKLGEAEDEGDTKKADRLSRKVAKKVERGSKHIEAVALSVEKHIERDGKAAAKHIVKGLRKLGLNEADYAEAVDAAAAAVNKAIDEVLKELEED